MPTVSEFYGIKIRMRYDEKHGPHFHASYGEFVARSLWIEQESMYDLARGIPYENDAE